MPQCRRALVSTKGRRYELNLKIARAYGTCTEESDGISSTALGAVLVCEAALLIENMKWVEVTFVVLGILALALACCFVPSAAFPFRASAGQGIVGQGIVLRLPLPS